AGGFNPFSNELCTRVTTVLCFGEGVAVELARPFLVTELLFADGEVHHRTDRWIEAEALVELRAGVLDAAFGHQPPALGERSLGTRRVVRAVIGVFLRRRARSGLGGRCLGCDGGEGGFGWRRGWDVHRSRRLRGNCAACGEGDQGERVRSSQRTRV